jgi:hypothetical protein
MSLMDTINNVCHELPGSHYLYIGMEYGSAWVECFNNKGDQVELPDSTDKTLEEELQDALKTVLDIPHSF